MRPSYHSFADLHELLPDANSVERLSRNSLPNILKWLDLKSPLILTARYKRDFMQCCELSVGDIRFQGLANQLFIELVKKFFLSFTYIQTTP